MPRGRARSTLDEFVVALALALSPACGRVDYDPLERDASTVDASADASFDASHDGAMPPPEAGIDEDGGASPPDGGDAGDPTRCDDAFVSALFCESWEAGRDTTVWPWVETMDLNTVGVSGTRPYRGESALEANAVNAGRSWVIAPALVPQRTTGEIWLRAYVYVPASATAPEIDTLQLVDARSPYHGVYLHITGERARAILSENGAATSDVAFPRERWNCVAIGIGIDGANGWLRLRTNTGADTLLNGVDTLPAAGYGNVHAGIYVNPAPTSEVSVSIDEIVIDDALIPCDPAL